MEAIIALITLSALEIVLGIDNIIFISILSDKLPEHQRARARFVGLGLALIMRILLLLSITWVLGLQKPLFELFGNEFSGRDLILILGGLFLMGKATYEIHHKVEMADQPHPIPKRISFGWAVVQIVLIDLVFSVDSVLTAIGMVRELWVMITAVIVSIGFMLAFAGSVSKLIDAHPSLKVLALAFLVLIGFNLLGEGFGYHIPKGYTYFAMAFSVAVEVINIRIGARKKA
ncbi:Membrane protein TerC, possibly involved in tellurium resistance [Armatimonadetes bacterium GBS]|nr:MAG: membrane protein [Fimbriimonadales bacterium]CUU11253.1 Membrane protein TerC, possibly involved in tellurium resistance [Armatimonadetes bacterium GBS]CUU34504.1 Membrane protein TerC, possibly involved in tellurium resistance [Armatimonadetes bacterium GXS]